ncbi:MAG TPA: glycosyltransferase family 39 protein [Aggregatilineaceae bacterium]|nr:glycosyltransferase family 39 protein [Aggregatilineaceae bacterium]
MRPNRSFLFLAPIIFLLLLQFYLRIHNPYALPGFVDEASHIARASIVYDFDQDPLLFSHGKLLYYYWLGIFRPGVYAELEVARWGLAIFTLLTSAFLMAVAREIAGRRAMLPALALYALAPLTVFFERTALADPFSGGMAALFVWQSIRFIRRPTPRYGALVGLLAALMTLAKLNTAFLIFMPLVVILIEQGLPTNRAAFKPWFLARWKQYARPLFCAGLVFGSIWLVLMGVSWWEKLANNQDAILIDTYIIDQDQAPSRYADKLEDGVTAAYLFFSRPLTWGIIAGILLALWKRPARALIPLAWLLLFWIPNIILSPEIQPRYLMAGVPALAALIGVSLTVLDDWLPMPRLRFRPVPILTVIALLAWAVFFALPFAADASSDPTKLDLLPKDYYNHFWGLQNGWGIVPALDYLEDHAERIDNHIPLALVIYKCSMYRIHDTPLFDAECQQGPRFTGLTPEKLHALDLWHPVESALQRWPYVYVITDYLLPTDPPPVENTEWELLYSFTRPHGGTVISSVWRVTP